MVVVRTSPLAREAYVVCYESRLQSINYIFAFHRMHIIKVRWWINGSIEGWLGIRRWCKGILSRRWCNGLSIQMMWMIWGCRYQLLNISYPGKPRCITPTLCSLNYICALRFKELNETHLHIYLYPMNLTSMTGSCRLLCYRTPVEVEWLPVTRER